MTARAGEGAGDMEILARLDAPVRVRESEVVERRVVDHDYALAELAEMFGGDGTPIPALLERLSLARAEIQQLQHRLVVELPAAQSAVATLTEARDAAQHRAAALADALELKLMDFQRQPDGEGGEEMVLRVGIDEWQAMTAALSADPSADPRACWPPTIDQATRDYRLREERDRLAAENAELRGFITDVRCMLDEAKVGQSLGAPNAVRVGLLIEERDRLTAQLAEKDKELDRQVELQWEKSRQLAEAREKIDRTEAALWKESQHRNTVVEQLHRTAKERRELVRQRDSYPETDISALVTLASQDLAVLREIYPPGDDPAKWWLAVFRSCRLTEQREPALMATEARTLARIPLRLGRLIASLTACREEVARLRKEQQRVVLDMRRTLHNVAAIGSGGTMLHTKAEARDIQRWIALLSLKEPSDA